MQTIRLKSTGSDVAELQRLLIKWGYRIVETGLFDGETDAAVREFQKRGRLTADGIVGRRTWELLLGENARMLESIRLKEEDFVRCAETLGVEVAAVKAVQEVETGGRGGFFALGRPAILFEGHIFWNQLKKNGKRPEDYLTGNGDILYPKWTKEHYKGGMGEYTRLNRAMEIDETAAICSASWGLFQIMGFNHTVCGCKDVKEFVAKMTTDEGSQLDLFTAFLQGNGWDKYLRSREWTEFARKYNGPAYAQNKYDEKLMKAYLKHKG